MFALDFLLFGGVSAANVTGPVVERELLAPIDALVAAMNRSDDRSIAALMTRDAVIIDEVAPYRWTGSQAEQHWSHDDGMLISKRGVSASHSARGKPTFVHRDATHAYYRAARVRLHPGAESGSTRPASGRSSWPKWGTVGASPCSDLRKPVTRATRPGTADAAAAAHIDRDL